MSADQKAIRNLIALWHRATAAGDVDTVLGLMAEDVVFLVAGQPPMRGRSSFESGLRALLKENRIESTGEVLEVEVSGDLAYSWTRLSVRVIPLTDGSEGARAGEALSVLRKQANGSWVVVRDANLLVPAS
jgi:uncharacterized protein (TIGR02246 family)